MMSELEASRRCIYDIREAKASAVSGIFYILDQIAEIECGLLNTLDAKIGLCSLGVSCALIKRSVLWE